MRFHPDIGALQRLDERGDASTTARHVAGCVTCGETVAWIHEARNAMRAPVTVAAPNDAWLAIRRRLEAGETVVLPPQRAEKPLATTMGPALRAAVVALVVLTGGMAAAAPGSPVREWLRAMVARIDAPLTPPADSVAPTEELAPAIFVIEPDANVATVDVTDPHTAVRLRIRLVDDVTMTVRADGEASIATFTSAAGRLTIAAPGAGDIHIDVPRRLSGVTIAVDGRPYLVRRGGELRIFLPGVDTAGAEIVLPIQR